MCRTPSDMTLKNSSTNWLQLFCLHHVWGRWFIRLCELPASEPACSEGPGSSPESFGKRKPVCICSFRGFDDLKNIFSSIFSIRQFFQLGLGHLRGNCPHPTGYCPGQSSCPSGRYNEKDKATAQLNCLKTFGSFPLKYIAKFSIVLQLFTIVSSVSMV